METSVVANAAMTQIAMAQKMMKMNADMQKQIVAVLEQAADNVPVSGRGSRVDLSA